MISQKNQKKIKNKKNTTKREKGEQTFVSNYLIQIITVFGVLLDFRFHNLYIAFV
jgi:hypothetical protein